MLCCTIKEVLQSDSDTFSIPAEEKQGWNKSSTSIFQLTCGLKSTRIVVTLASPAIS